MEVWVECPGLQSPTVPSNRVRAEYVTMELPVSCGGLDPAAHGASQ